ncbi:hypothetical protein GW17_00020124 [Ensete ventricosum]|nr:hypothetical protein GW17_00020124 [Ensete ventricosum]
MSGTAAIACRRVGAALRLPARSGWSTSTGGGAPFGCSARSISSSQLVKTNGNRAFLVDTLALVRGLEAQGIPSKHAEAITSSITEVLNHSLESVAQSFVSKAEMQKVWIWISLYVCRCSSGVLVNVDCNNLCRVS